jgi:membrane protein
LLKIRRILLTKTPIGFLIRKSKVWQPPGFESLPLYDVVRFFWSQVKTHGLSERAAAISYNFVMAIPPSLLFLLTLIPNLPFFSKKSLKLELRSVIYDIIPSNVYNKEVIKYVDSFIDNSRIGLLSFGLLLSLFFASNAIMGLMKAFNRRSYHGFETRKGLLERWIALRVTIAIFGLLLGYLILLIMQGTLLEMIVTNELLRDVISYTRWALIIGLLYLIIAFIYKQVPSVKVKWKMRSPGALLATTLSIIASFGFSIFVNNFGKYNALYGSIGTIMVIMALIFINALALLIGFELNVSIKTLKAKAHLRQQEEAAQKLNDSMPIDTPLN